MTLNITLATQDRIYQSSDFQLTIPGKGAVDYDSMKAVHLSGQHFYGALTYTGVGEWENRSTAEHVLEWLRSTDEIDFAGLAQAVAEHGTEWLRRIHLRTRQRSPHTFVIAGFEKGLARVAFISNFESIKDPRPTVRDTLVATSLGRINKPVALVTGQRGAIARATRRSLEHAARRYADRPQRVRQMMSEANAAAARSAQANKAVSTDCAVFSIDRGGTGQLTLSGAKSIEWYSAPGWPAGLRPSEMAKRLGVTNPRLVGVSTATSSGQPYAVPAAACRVPLTFPEGSVYTATALLSPGHTSARCTGISRAAKIVGCGSTSSAPATANLWTWEHGNFRDLELTATNTARIAINEEGEVAGAYSEGVGRLEPFVTRDGKVVPLMPDAKVDAAAQALSPDGTAVGYASLNSADRGQLHHRPAVWSPLGEIDLLEDIPADWGTAIAVNRSAHALLWMYEGMQPITALYRGTRLELLEGTGMPGVVPVGVDDSDRVLAFYNDDNGRPNTLMCARGRTPERIGQPGWRAAAISANGWLAGSYRDGGFDRPWVRAPDSSVDSLPYMPDHWCRPTAVNDVGDVVGTCAADGHEHAVYWQRRGNTA